MVTVATRQSYCHDFVRELEGLHLDMMPSLMSIYVTLQVEE